MKMEDIPKELLEEIVEEVLDSKSDPTVAMLEKARFIDNVSFFDMDNAVPVWGEINESQALKFFNRLNLLSSILPDDSPITVYINSPGGDVSQGMLMIDAMRSIPQPVITFATGMCGSAGLFLLAAGDVRVASKNATFFYHEPIARGEISSPLEAEALAFHYEHIRKVFNEILFDACKNIKRRTSYDKKFKNQTSMYFTSEQALEELGLIEKII